jgi:hypothetical protein
MSGMSRCALRSWMARATSSLPGAGLARDEHGALGLGHRSGRWITFLIARLRADDPVVIELLVALADR